MDLQQQVALLLLNMMDLMVMFLTSIVLRIGLMMNLDPFQCSFKFAVHTEEKRRTGVDSRFRLPERRGWALFLEA